MVLLMELVSLSRKVVMYFTSTTVMNFCRKAASIESTYFKDRINSLCYIFIVVAINLVVSYGITKYSMCKGRMVRG